MIVSNATNSDIPEVTQFMRSKVLLFAMWFLLQCSACGRASEDTEGRALPTDEQVIADVMPADKENVVAVEVVAGRTGEAYLHPQDLVWYFDRGVVIKRKADVAGVPDAVVVVGGLARYQLVGQRYKYRQFLTTYNEYEGIPAPTESELTEFVNEHLKQVFVSRDHNIVEISAVRLVQDTPWTWHTTTSFTAPFKIRYVQRKNNTTLERRGDVFDIRFYKKTVKGPVNTLMATEKSRIVLGQETLGASEIDRMKTLRTDFR